MTVVLIVAVVNSFLSGGSCGGGYGVSCGGGCCGCSVGAVTLAGSLDSLVSMETTGFHSLPIYTYDKEGFLFLISVE